MNVKLYYLKSEYITSFDRRTVRMFNMSDYTLTPMDDNPCSMVATKYDLPVRAVRRAKWGSYSESYYAFDPELQEVFDCLIEQAIAENTRPLYNRIDEFKLQNDVMKKWVEHYNSLSIWQKIVRAFKGE